MNTPYAVEVEARIMGANTIAKYLNVGQSFRFPKSDEVMVHRGRGWYTTASGKKYRTGIRTGVIAI